MELDYDATTAALRAMIGTGVIVVIRREGSDDPIATLHGSLGTNEATVEEVGAAALAASRVPGGPAPFWVIGGPEVSMEPGRGGGTFRLEAKNFVRGEWGEPWFRRSRRPLVVTIAGDLRIDVVPMGPTASA